MTPHNNAKLGDYASIVLMPGDPKRADHIAKEFLMGATVVNTVRNNFGYTGYYRDHKVSVQASGMGQPSLAIYATELFTKYNVNTIIRVGTCGALSDSAKLGDCVIAMSSATDSSIANVVDGFSLAPCCDFDLLYEFMRRTHKIDPWIGQMVSVDSYYNDNPDWYKRLAECGVIAVDMETHMLYQLAAKHKRRALSVNIVSDVIPTQEHMSVDEKEVVLDTVVQEILNSL